MIAKINRLGSGARDRKRGARALLDRVLTFSCISTLFVGGGFSSVPGRQIHTSAHLYTGELPSTFLLGIFSVNTELYRRQLIRNSYLRGSAATCSLQEYILTHSKNCRIIYTFVVGANDEGAPRYDSSSAEGITIDAPDWARTHGEDDLVYLNIRENMEEGKTSTWFQYASDISVTHRIDYISKLDSDTYVDLQALLSLMDTDLPAIPSTGPDHRKRYGGILREYNTCGGFPHCLLLQGRVYMSGQFYFVSTDLARFVSSGRVDENALGVGFEDFDFGLRIFSYPGTINLVILSTGMITIHNAETKKDSWWEDSLGNFPQHASRSEELASIETCLMGKAGSWRGCVPEK